MKNPMHNISADAHGYLMRIRRPDLTYTKWFSFGQDKTAALKRAMAERDDFFAKHGAGGRTGQRPRSNTGIAGISEVTKWSKNIARHCFSVTAGRPLRPVSFFYRGQEARPAALKKAIAYRAQRTGESPAQLWRQAQEVCCV